MPAIPAGKRKAWPGHNNVVGALTLNLFQGIQDSLVHDPKGSHYRSWAACNEAGWKRVY